MSASSCSAFGNEDESGAVAVTSVRAVTSAAAISSSPQRRMQTRTGGIHMARKWWTLTAVSVATFMLLLDITVVNVALPSIQEDLNATFTDLQWVVDAYTLSLAALVLTAGVLADRLGRRRVFDDGLGIFTIASLAAGL